MAKLSTQENISPLDISDLAYQIGLKIDIKILCTLLLRFSNSVSLIKGSTISNYFLPLLKSSEDFPRTLTISNTNQINKRESFEDSEDLADLENDILRKSKLIKKLTEGASTKTKVLFTIADTLFNKKISVTEAIHNKIIDKVINGKEYQVITKSDLILCIKKLGIQLEIEDISVLKSMFPTLIGSFINVEMLIEIMKELKINEDIPPPSKYLDFSKLTGNSIRIFNKIINYMQNNKINEIESFVGKEKIDIIDFVSQKKQDSIQTITSEVFWDILLSKDIIRFKDELDENIIDFLSVGEQYPDILMIRKLKRTIKNIEKWKYFSFFGFHKREMDYTQNKSHNMLNGSPNLKRSYSHHDCFESNKSISTSERNGVSNNVKKRILNAVENWRFK